MQWNGNNYIIIIHLAGFKVYSNLFYMYSVKVLLIGKILNVAYIILRPT